MNPLETVRSKPGVYNAASGVETSYGASVATACVAGGIGIGFLHILRSPAYVALLHKMRGEQSDD